MSFKVNALHKLGFQVLLWVTPFCDVNASVYKEGVQHRYWVMTKYDITSPAKVRWWNNQHEGSAVLDVTNPNALRWFTQRLQQLKYSLGIDGFKLDAGEVSYIPSPSTSAYFNISQLGNGTLLNEYTRLYNSITDNLAGWTEMRSAWKHQATPEFLRIMDLDSTWGRDNGLRAMIPRVLLFSTLGYRYTLPDMIGGNGYGPGRILFNYSSICNI